MEQVYCIYEAHPDPDGWTDFQLVSVCTTMEKAKELINKCKDIIVKKGVHPSMNETNNYTYVGYRDDCNNGYLYGFGGYVIEVTDTNVLL